MQNVLASVDGAAAVVEIADIADNEGEAVGISVD